MPESLRRWTSDSLTLILCSDRSVYSSTFLPVFQALGQELLKLDDEEYRDRDQDHGYPALKG